MRETEGMEYQIRVTTIEFKTHNVCESDGRNETSMHVTMVRLMTHSVYERRGNHRRA